MTSTFGNEFAIKCLVIYNYFLKNCVCVCVSIVYTETHKDNNVHVCTQFMFSWLIPIYIKINVMPYLTLT